jgi:hypothetical protein
MTDGIGSILCIGLTICGRRPGQVAGDRRIALAPSLVQPARDLPRIVCRRGSHESRIWASAGGWREAGERESYTVPFAAETGVWSEGCRSGAAGVVSA